METKTKTAKGTEARKAELEAQMLKLQGELEDTSAAPARQRILGKLKALNAEYGTYYQD